MVLVVLASVSLYAKRGIFSAVSTFLITFIASLATINYYKLVEKLILKVHEGTTQYADATALLLTFFIVFLILQYAAISFLEESITINAAVNALGGAFFGGLAGFLLAGILAISWFMLPGSIYYRGTEEESHATQDVDELFLKVVRFMANDRLNGSVPFDASHDFMREKTNKFATAPEETRQDTFGSDRTRGNRPGMAQNPNLSRTRGTEEYTDQAP